MDIMVQIRKAKLVDASRIAKMHRASFIEAHKSLLTGDWLINASLEGFNCRWQKRLSNRKMHIYVAEFRKKIVGLICFSQFPKIKIAEILFFYVDPKHLRQGIGRKLMAFVTQELAKKQFKMVHLWALKNNPKSRAFYESMGARTDGTERVVDKPAHSTHEVEYYLFLDKVKNIPYKDRLK